MGIQKRAILPTKMPRLAILGQKRYIEPMGKRLALPLLFLFAVMPALGQEVVVFSDHRSLVVSSHRQSGSWTYLALPGGEIAVPTARITDIHAENISAEAMVATQASMATSSSASEPPQSFVPDSQVAEAGSPSSDSPPPVPSRFGQPILERPKVLQAVRTKGTSAGTLRSLLPGH
jgi:hypothetical protein